MSRTLINYFLQGILTAGYLQNLTGVFLHFQFGVDSYLGHSQFSTTADIYSHRDYSHQQQATNVAADIIRRVQPKKETDAENCC